MARTIPRPIKLNLPGLRPGNSKVQPTLGTHDFICLSPFPYLPFPPHHSSNLFLYSSLPWNHFVKGDYEFPLEKSPGFFSVSILVGISLECDTTDSPLLETIFPFPSLHYFPLAFLLFHWLVPLCLLCPTFSYFNHFFASKVWVFSEIAFLFQSIHCTLRASLCWGPSDFSRWGLSLEHLSPVLHV